MRLAGAHVVLTGATGSIGSRLAERLAGRGARLTVTARSAEALDELAARTGALAVPADLADEGGPASLLTSAQDRHGPVDVLVHNAAVEVAGRLEELDADGLAAAVALNVRAPLELTRLALPGMRERRRGHLVLVSSLAGVATFPGLTLYGATKAALTQAAAGLSLDLRGSGVGTTLVEIGPVSSTMMSRVRDHPPTAAAFTRAARLRVLRDLDPDEVAGAVVAAVEANRRHVRLPRRAAVLAATAGLPRAVVRTALVGIEG
ncbi:SDR family NAD(P)-dependent oxidoreductase [Phycicoccus flavus]|uniref:SDR family NAD(P)-dependent oxidoreductase n=1 Tax=Phycicoccus flavus TaxID=2502783 RepID=A0A8T6R6X6_9MICO|nr:SDR family NAD(P)-dependent oxidoreductase [Phycicoccus flavus]NHA69313.1 SDR family NAD(P)-dependent oxidoreductase [Phycicoccus flavus]